ncbi:MAG TPA: hypothetical protein VFH51_16980 [Myxococcota bacterium]|nr:hypothetical protein [Myxococcota bacterium]
MKIKGLHLSSLLRSPKAGAVAAEMAPRTGVTTTLHQDASVSARLTPSLDQVGVSLPSPVLLPPPMMSAPTSPIPDFSRGIAPPAPRATVALGPRVRSALREERGRAVERDAYARRTYARARAMGMTCTEVCMDHVAVGPFFMSRPVVLHLAAEPEDKVSAEALLHLPFFIPRDETGDVVRAHMADFAKMARDVATWCAENGLEPPAFALMSERRDRREEAQTHWPLVGFFCCTRLRGRHKEPVPARPSSADTTGSLQCMADLLDGPDDGDPGPSPRRS